MGDEFQPLGVKRVVRVVKRGKPRYGRLVGFRNNWDNSRTFYVCFGSRKVPEACRNVSFCHPSVGGVKSVILNKPTHSRGASIPLEELEAMI
jgi:hypothetical protein